MSDDLEYLTTEQVAARIGMSPEYVARQCKAGALPAVKLGTTWRISSASLAAFMGGAVKPVARDRKSARQLRRSA